MDLKNMGEPKIKIVAMPRDTNPAGNIFGGWILAQIDKAGAVAAREVAPIRVVTISFKEVIFKEPVFVGDLVSCYAKIIGVGKTSIKVKVDVIVQRLNEDNKVVKIPVTSAEVTYVSVDRAGNKRVIDEDLKKICGF
ncbi:acyl-CoA thioesterase [Campylobacter ureolyticus RIGS 9880]|uniref:Acyl-CoA thioesterase n=2 Tax=Campylobacter ureolyticus TaxID=827 RepID=A0A2I1NAY3_9BACT|nr:acyl-CoA thioesterase [Campylobacter ureolyticus]AKT91267.1 acyl-CoA thioesterase [Campylobacter ureolyticus RIGS 9880]MCR8685109.1 acyl-CoA thioesterase [Campylobacter ureolyticus]MCR8700060.1 acyl-CoA thioesterase [Campylobacter ureolyticus]MCZ6133011.1 acyl-CoA thioesterase [Campylobacter ureolyticus]MCZ6156274.1 acyl-CoA thioesterase [Campylobacter ureolyticus]